MIDYDKIDFYRLREDLQGECYGAFFGAGCEGALMESFDVEDASPEDFLEMAEEYGLDLSDYLDT